MFNRRIVKTAAFGLAIAVIAAIPTGASASTGHRDNSAQMGRVGTLFHVPNQLDVKLLSYRVTGGNSTIQPRPGYKFVVTYWYFHNPYNRPIYVSAQGFELVSGSDTNLPEMNSTHLKLIDNDTLGLVGQTYKPGHSDTDEIVFQVKTGALKNPSMLNRLVFAPFFIHPDIQAVWRIGRGA